MIGLTIMAFVLYLVIGLVCAFPIMRWGLPHIDHTVRDSTIGFKLIALPGCIVLWPVMLIKWGRA